MDDVAARIGAFPPSVCVSIHKITAILSIARSTVMECLGRAASAQRSWPLPNDLNDDALKVRGVCDLARLCAQFKNAMYGAHQYQEHVVMSLDKALSNLTTALGDPITIVLTIIVVALAMRPATLGVAHQRAALPIHSLIVAMFGILALVCIGGGVYAISANAESKTELSILGAHLTTGHVGVAFVGLGLIIVFLAVRAVLKSQHALAALPPDAETKKKST